MQRTLGLVLVLITLLVPMAGLRASALVLPVAPWSGRLVLPAASERFDDGAVLIELENWPADALPGVGADSRPRLPLVWEGAPFPAGTDLAFTAESFRDLKGTSAGNCLLGAPFRLDGWKAVSPLESLAGARRQDDVRVALVAPELRGSSRSALGVELVVRREPVQVLGRSRILVRFTGPSDGGALLARHWNPERGDFSGPACEIAPAVDPPVLDHLPEGLQRPMTSLEAIWTSPLNETGWYVTGRGDGEAFLLESLEPRALFSLDREGCSFGTDRSWRWMEEELWSEALCGERHGSIRRHDLEASRAVDKGALRSGERLLLLHLFGSWGTELRDEAKSLRTGHFAFGFATVVTCPFTGEERFDCEYLQVYANNPEGIVSGTKAWHEYMGSLRRGWMFLRPVTDMLVRFSPLMGEVGTEEVDAPAARLRRSLEWMMAAYRTGGGTGANPVTPLNSCVQDSIQGLFLAAEAMKIDLLGRAEDPLAAFLFDGSDGDARSVDRLFFKAGPPLFPIPRVWRQDWKANRDDPTRFRRGQPVIEALAVLDALNTSRRSMVPRTAQEELARLFLLHGARINVLQSFQVGGRIEGIHALPPDGIDWRSLRGALLRLAGR